MWVITHVLHREPFCAQRIAWRLQNRILVSVKIKLQAITSDNDNVHVGQQVSCIIVCTVSGIVLPSGFHVLQGLSAALVQYMSHTLYKLSLASQPYFSSCACPGERGRGKGRKNTSGKMYRVFVPKRNVILLRCFPKSHDMDAGKIHQ